MLGTSRPHASSDATALPPHFLPPVINPAEKAKRVAAAKALCHSCPVQRECLNEAIALGDRYATRAAYTGPERRQLKRRGLLPLPEAL